MFFHDCIVYVRRVRSDSYPPSFLVANLYGHRIEIKNNNNIFENLTTKMGVNVEISVGGIMIIS